jgi:hypothetical protein
MGNAMEAHKNAGRQVIFSFEEAIGFACGDVVRDKDGVSAAAVFAEMSGVLAREGKTAVQQLQWLYEVCVYMIDVPTVNDMTPMCVCVLRRCCCSDTVISLQIINTCLWTNHTKPTLSSPGFGMKATIGCEWVI